MAVPPHVGYLPLLNSREDYVDHLENLAFSDVPKSTEGRSKRTRIKTYMLETARYGQSVPELDSLFPDTIHLHRLDDTLYRVQDATHEDKVVGLIETFGERHPVFYTTLPAAKSDAWIRGAVDRNPWLDRLWLSSQILFELWKHVQRTTSPRRYVRLGFEHEAWYEASSDLDAIEEEDIYDDDDISGESEDFPVSRIERRRSKVTLTEQLELLNTTLKPLMDMYDPLHSLVQMQIPGEKRGGHNLYYNGRATDWSDSFVEHRATISMVVRLYRNITTLAENRLWVEAAPVGQDGFSLSGAPLTIIFRRPLSEATFNRFVELGIQRSTSRFRIGGYVTRRGPTKIHLAGIDHHLWQPFLLEATSKHLIGVLPRGTCGNTIHRLVTNVQRFLDPKVDVWLGDEKYEDAVTESMNAA